MILVYVLAVIGALTVAATVVVVAFFLYVSREVDKQRCSCGRYYGRIIVRDDWGQHSPVICQPWREIVSLT